MATDGLMVTATVNGVLAVRAAAADPDPELTPEVTVTSTV